MMRYYRDAFFIAIYSIISKLQHINYVLFSQDMEVVPLCHVC